MKFNYIFFIFSFFVLLFAACEIPNDIRVDIDDPPSISGLKQPIKIVTVGNNLYVLDTTIGLYAVDLSTTNFSNGMTFTSSNLIFPKASDPINSVKYAKYTGNDSDGNAVYVDTTVDFTTTTMYLLDLVTDNNNSLYFILASQFSVSTSVGDQLWYYLFRYDIAGDSFQRAPMSSLRDSSSDNSCDTTTFGARSLSVYGNGVTDGGIFISSGINDKALRHIELNSDGSIKQPYIDLTEGYVAGGGTLNNYHNFANTGPILPATLTSRNIGGTVYSFQASIDESDSGIYYYKKETPAGNIKYIDKSTGNLGTYYDIDYDYLDLDSFIFRVTFSPDPVKNDLFAFTQTGIHKYNLVNFLSNYYLSPAVIRESPDGSIALDGIVVYDDVALTYKIVSMFYNRKKVPDYTRISFYNVDGGETSIGTKNYINANGVVTSPVLYKKNGVRYLFAIGQSNRTVFMYNLD